MELNGVEIDDTYAEAFDGLVSRMIVTLRDEQLMQYTAAQCSALPSIVVGRTEAGYDPEKPEKSLKKFYKELGLRIRQGILVVPTTTVFNGLESKTKFDMMENVGYCGDVYQEDVELYGRQMIKIPLMMGDWFIERQIGYLTGVSGGNIWLMCDSEKSALRAGKKILNTLYPIENIITPFAICSAGSKTVYEGQPHPEIGPTTNHQFCPTLRDEIKDSEIPEGVVSIPEIVINGLTLGDVKYAMKLAITEASKVKGVLKISAGNFGGTLGTHEIRLHDLLKNNNKK
ncbi:MAG: formylmethanofuran--tetrahydromethanopterin N-formyltransferase [Candidatus Heimdallarchaeota archaeon]